MANSILVIGSVLLDIVGTYKDSQKDLINKTGNLNFSVGGVAFNIASNLSSKEKPTAIWTCLKKDSISSKVIEDTLKTSRIRDYIHHVDWIKETGYVAHFCDKELKTGITSSEIEFINYGKIKSLTKIIKNSDFVILDTNLSTDQIKHICKICLENSKKVFVSVVSDAKFNRVYKQKFPIQFESICVRHDELESLQLSVKEIINEKQKVKAFCRDLNAKTVYINSELNGYYVLSDSGEHEYNKVKYDNIDIKNTLGANDALFSAVCASAYDKESITGNEVKMNIKEWVTEVLKIEGSNLASMDNNKHDNRLELFKVVTTILFLVFAVTSTVIGSFIPNLKLLYFGLLIFSTALFGGATGALSREMVSRLMAQNRRYLTMGQSIALGMIAGTLSSLIGILPGIASSGGIQQLANQDLLPLMIFIVSISTGIALDIFFDNLSKKNPNDIIEIN